MIEDFVDRATRWAAAIAIGVAVLALAAVLVLWAQKAALQVRLGIEQQQRKSAEGRADANAKALFDLKEEYGRAQALAQASVDERRRWQSVATTAKEKLREAPPSADVPLDPAYRAALCSLRDNPGACS